MTVLHRLAMYLKKLCLALISGAGGDFSGGLEVRPARLTVRMAPAGQNLVQVVGPDRFAEVVIHACVETRLAVALHRVSRERDDWNVLFRSLLPLANCPGRFVAVHGRQ